MHTMFSRIIASSVDARAGSGGAGGVPLAQ